MTELIAGEMVSAADGMNVAPLRLPGRVGRAWPVLAIDRSTCAWRWIPGGRSYIDMMLEMKICPGRAQAAPSSVCRTCRDGYPWDVQGCAPVNLKLDGFVRLDGAGMVRYLGNYRGKWNDDLIGVLI